MVFISRDTSSRKCAGTTTLLVLRFRSEGLCIWYSYFDRMQEHLVQLEGLYWVGPPPTYRGILGIYYKDPNIITITPCGHY